MTDPFDAACEDLGRSLKDLGNETHQAREGADRRRARINGLIDEVQHLAETAGASGLDLPSKLGPSESPDALNCLLPALAALPGDQRSVLEELFFKSVPPFPPFDDFDVFFIVALGGMALLADFLLVGLPPKTRWVPKNEGGAVPAGWVSERLHSWRVGNDNWLARLCKVPFDKPILPGTDAGLTPSNHRLLSFGHDPSPIGMVFGLMDIASGGMSGITSDGRMFHLPGVPPDINRVLMGPLVWVGHLASDVATQVGLPVPGWSLTQVLRLRSPGSPEGETVAEVGQMMYLQGYDFRHYLAGGGVAALIEIIVRTYHFLRYRYPLTKAAATDVVSSNLAEHYIEEFQLEGHLTAMLFWAHAMACAANGGKIAVQGVTGSYFGAVRAINLAQWQLFALETIRYVAHRLRARVVEQTVQNRKELNERWDALTLPLYVPEYIQADEAPRLTVAVGTKE